MRGCTDRFTLFPYTTLFRSFDEVGHVLPAFLRPEHHVTGDDAVDAAGVLPLRVVEEAAEELAVLDRKSTRLNSSHVEISYAVFCLKKKNIISQYQRYKNKFT